jgi:hypothetical protein
VLEVLGWFFTCPQQTPSCQTWFEVRNLATEDPVVTQLRVSMDARDTDMDADARLLRGAAGGGTAEQPVRGLDYSVRGMCKHDCR